MELSSNKYCELCQKNNVEKVFSGVKLCSTCKSDIVKLVEGDKEICRKYADARNFPNATDNAKKEIIDMAAQRLKGKDKKSKKKSDISGTLLTWGVIGCVISIFIPILLPLSILSLVIGFLMIVFEVIIEDCRISKRATPTIKYKKPDIKCKMCKKETSDTKYIISDDEAARLCKDCYKRLNERLKVMPYARFATRVNKQRFFEDFTASTNYGKLVISSQTEEAAEEAIEYFKKNEQKLLPEFNADITYECTHGVILIDSNKGQFTFCSGEKGLEYYKQNKYMIFEFKDVESFGITYEQSEYTEYERQYYREYDPVKDEWYDEYYEVPVKHVNDEGYVVHLAMKYPNCWSRFTLHMADINSDKVRKQLEALVRNFYRLCFKFNENPISLPTPTSLYCPRINIKSYNIDLYKMAPLELAEFNLNELIPDDATVTEKIAFLDKYIEKEPILKPERDKYVQKWLSETSSQASTVTWVRPKTAEGIKQEMLNTNIETLLNRELERLMNQRR